MDHGSRIFTISGPIPRRDGQARRTTLHAQHCIVLAAVHDSAHLCIALHMTALHCTAHHYTTLHNSSHGTQISSECRECPISGSLITRSHCTVQNHTALHCTVQNHTALHCTAIHYTALHFKLHCTKPRAPGLAGQTVTLEPEDGWELTCTQILLLLLPLLLQLLLLLLLIHFLLSPLTQLHPIPLDLLLHFSNKLFIFPLKN